MLIPDAKDTNTFISASNAHNAKYSYVAIANTAAIATNTVNSTKLISDELCPPHKPPAIM